MDSCVRRTLVVGVWRAVKRSAALAVVLLAGTVAGQAGAVEVFGFLTNSLTSGAVEGAVVTFAPPVAGSFTSDATGFYSADVPAGNYTVTFTDARYTTQSQPVNLTGAPVSLDVILVPKAPVLVSTALTGDPVPGAVVQAVGTFEILDGSSPMSVTWTQEPGGVAVQIANADQETADVTLPGDTLYKDELIKILAEPPADPAANLPPGIELPPGEFFGGLQDRYQVVAVNPLMHEEAAHTALLFTVVTSSGTYTDTLDVQATLPWKVASGLQNVPIGRPVLLHAKDRPVGDTDPYDWTLIRPGGSGAVLMDATTQDSWFTPDLEGKYTLHVTDPATTDLIAIDVYAGTWVGVITGKDAGIDGLPLAEGCTSLCHNDVTKIAPDKFTPWRQSGHAEIFTDNLNTSTHYGEACFQCHTVGYDPDVDNGGFDDAADYPDFLASGLINNVPSNPTDNWSTVVSDFPATARLANAQCENCHGPRSELAAHGNESVSVSLASTNCAQCHGEPLRHGRYQQWQLSTHANYELAQDEGTSGSCARCHSVNGFLTWLPILLDDDPNTDPLANITVTWTRDQVHPQTCVTCHDPHDPGSQSGDPTNATVRISGDTPPLIAGFTATDVGKGAMCMTCHNTRRGLRNDAAFPTLTNSNIAQAPHPGAQTDVLMGQNAYFVTVGNRGWHSNRTATSVVADTCVSCHMEATPPPPDLSYSQSGTNHTFWARKTICTTCHVNKTAEQVQGPVTAKLETLRGDIEVAIVDTMDVETQKGNTIQLMGSGTTVLGTITDVSEITSIEYSTEGIVVTLGGGDPIGPVSLSRVLVVDGTATSLGNLYWLADPALPKGAWNYQLVVADASLGVHNPEFATEVLDASISAVQAIPEPGSLAAALAALGALGALGRRSRRGA